MARKVDDILRDQLGNLLLQLSIVQSQVETLIEKNQQLEAQLKEVKAEAKSVEKVEE